MTDSAAVTGISLTVPLNPPTTGIFNFKPSATDVGDTFQSIIEKVTEAGGIEGPGETLLKSAGIGFSGALNFLDNIHADQENNIPINAQTVGIAAASATFGTALGVGVGLAASAGTTTIIAGLAEEEIGVRVELSSRYGNPPQA